MNQTQLHEISKVEYDPMNNRVVFYTRINGFNLPFSTVYKDLGDDAYLPTNLTQLTRLTGITYNDIFQGQQTIH